MISDTYFKSYYSNGPLLSSFFMLAVYDSNNQPYYATISSRYQDGRGPNDIYFEPRQCFDVNNTTTGDIPAIFQIKTDADGGNPNLFVTDPFKPSLAKDTPVYLSNVGYSGPQIGPSTANTGDDDGTCYGNTMTIIATNNQTTDPFTLQSLYDTSVIYVGTTYRIINNLGNTVQAKCFTPSILTAQQRNTAPYTGCIGDIDYGLPVEIFCYEGVGQVPTFSIDCPIATGASTPCPFALTCVESINTPPQTTYDCSEASPPVNASPFRQITTNSDFYFVPLDSFFQAAIQVGKNNSDPYNTVTLSPSVFTRCVDIDSAFPAASSLSETIQFFLFSDYSWWTFNYDNLNENNLIADINYVTNRTIEGACGIDMNILYCKPGTNCGSDNCYGFCSGKGETCQLFGDKFSCSTKIGSFFKRLFDNEYFLYSFIAVVIILFILFAIGIFLFLRRRRA